MENRRGILIFVSLVVMTVALGIIAESHEEHDLSFVQTRTELRQLQVGDFLEFETGEIYLVTHLIDNGCRYSSPINGQGDRVSYDFLSVQVRKIHKRNSAGWNEIAMRYCSPPFGD